MASDFTPGTPVAYIPLHANGDIEHPDVEYGIVSSSNEKYVFVKYKNYLHPIATNPQDLRLDLRLGETR